MTTRNGIISIVLVCLMARESLQYCCELKNACWNQNESQKGICDGDTNSKKRGIEVKGTYQEDSFCFWYEGSDTKVDKRHLSYVQKCQKRDNVLRILYNKKGQVTSGMNVFVQALSEIGRTRINEIFNFSDEEMRIPDPMEDLDLRLI